MAQFTSDPGHEQFPPHTNGTIPPDTADAMWEDMSATERLPIIMDHFDFREWLGFDALPTLAIFRKRPSGKWGKIKARYKDIGGNPRDLQEAIDTLLEDAQKTSAQETLAPPATKQPVVVNMSDVKAEAVEWLWWPYLALGKLAMLDGEPGVGKSLCMVTVAGIMSKGWNLPDQQGMLTLPTGGPQTTLLLSAEDGLADTIKPRLEAAGADCDKVKALTGWRDTNDASGEQQFFTLEHLPVLEHAMQQSQPRLVVVDPIQAYLGAKIDMNQASQTRPLLAALAHLAEAYHCAIVLVRHPAKSGQGRAIHRGLGSIDFIGAARTALFVEQHPVDPGAALLCQTKNNLGPLGRTQVFTKDQGEFHWKGVSRLTAEVLAGSGRGPDPTAFLEAVCWLEQRLEGSLVWPAEDILTEGGEGGHTRKLLYKAKKSLGVVSNQLADYWTWRLPALTVQSPPLPSSLGSLGYLPSLRGENALSPQGMQDAQDPQITSVVEKRVVVVEGTEDSNVSTPLSGDTGVSRDTEDTGVSDLVAGAETVDTAETPWDQEYPETPDTPVSRVVQQRVAWTVCPQCTCEHLMDCVTYLKCPVCSWQGS